MKKNDQLRIDKNLKLIAKSSAIVFVGLLLSKIFTYAYRIIIARNFGPEIYGVFSLALMIFGWFVIFASLGFSEGLIRHISWFRGKKKYLEIKYLFNFSICFTIFSGIFSGILLFFLSEKISILIFNNYQLIIFLKAFAILIPFYLANNIFLSVLQGFEEVRRYSFILNIFNNFLKVFLIIILLFFGFKTNAIIFSYFMSIIGMLLLSRHYGWKLIKKIAPNSLEGFKRRVVRKEFFSYSWPLLFSGVVSEIFVWADLFLVGYFLGVAEVGFYNSAVPIVALLFIIPEIFLKLFFPLITKEFARKEVGLVKKLSQQVGKWIFTLNLPLFLALFLFPGAIINFLFGEEYLVAANALRILATGTFISSLIWIHHNLLSMAGKSKLIFNNFLLFSGLNILMNIFLIPLFGITGAALATTISRILLSIVLFFQVKNKLEIIPFKKEILKIGLISIIPATMVLLLRKLVEINKLSLILIGILFLLTYILLLFTTKSLDKNDFMVLGAIKRKIFPKT